MRRIGIPPEANWNCPGCRLWVGASYLSVITHQVDVGLEMAVELHEYTMHDIPPHEQGELLGVLYKKRTVGEHETLMGGKDHGTSAS